MAHPFHEHKDHKVQKKRVHHIAKGYASGGAVHDDEKADAALIKRTVKKSAMKMDGGRVKQRADRKPRRASGGPVNKPAHHLIRLVMLRLIGKMENRAECQRQRTMPLRQRCLMMKDAVVAR